MDQKNLTFVPHVLPVLRGTTVDFLNSDAVNHNVFSPDACADKFNLGSFRQGQVRTHAFREPCFATLLCIVHPEMEAFVAVLPTPDYAVTAPDGSYAIGNVADGSYTLKVWHPKLKSVTRKIDVHGEVSEDFDLSR